MKEKIARIDEKIQRLRNLDKDLILFAADSHRYEINPVVPVKKVLQFEKAHQISLPEEYVEFITNVGNGGVGPYYGLEPFENCLYYDLDNKLSDYLLNPGMPFQHTKAWNMTFKPNVDEDIDESGYEDEFESFQRQYFDPEYMNGVIAICNYGCGVSLNLVVKGKEYGNIWTDDRASDNGIYPSTELGNEGRITFLDWYELWLDNSIKEVAEKVVQTERTFKAENNLSQKKRSWWKIW